MSDKDLKPPPHLSASSIGTFQQCPLKFKFNKIDLIPDEPGEAAVLGNFVHDILEAMYKLSPEERTKESAKVTAKYVWENLWEEQVLRMIRGEEKIRMFRWQAWWCVENLWKIEDPQSIEPVGLEFEVYGEIGGVTVKGFIDRYTINPETGMIVVSDYKTGKTPRDQYLDDKFFQLNIYANMVESMGVGQVEEIELLYLKDGIKKQRKATSIEKVKAVEVIQETKAEVDKRCDDGYFEPIKSALCNWCSYKKICPAWNK
jgi:putative RecB family exonuclease